MSNDDHKSLLDWQSRITVKGKEIIGLFTEVYRSRVWQAKSTAPARARRDSLGAYIIDLQQRITSGQQVQSIYVWRAQLVAWLYASNRDTESDLIRMVRVSSKRRRIVSLLEQFRDLVMAPPSNLWCRRY